jgi:hypothetical protein
VKATLGSKVGLGIAIATAAGFVGLASPAANAATTTPSLRAVSSTSTQSEARACFQALGVGADEDLQAASYDIVEFGPWMTDVQQAQAGMRSPACTPFAAHVQGPIAQAEALIAQADEQAATGDVTDASNTFFSAANALNPAWEYVANIAGI